MLVRVDKRQTHVEQDAKPITSKISSFCGIIVAFQSARKTSLKPVISHMESAVGPAGWSGKHRAGRVPNARGDSEKNSLLLIKNLIPALVLVIST